MATGTVALIGTLPGIFSIISGLLVGRFAGTAIKYKTFLILALVITSIGGSCSVLFPLWSVLLFSRMCVGFGVGIFFALPPALIMKYYSGDAQRSKLGLASSFGSAGGLLMMLAVGVLADIQWNFIFLIYSVAVIPLILVLIGLKEPERPLPSSAALPKAKNNIPLPILLNFVMVFMLSLLGMTAMVFISSVIITRGLGTSVHAGVVAMMFNISGMILSVLFAPLYKIFKKYLAIIALVIVNIGLVLVYFATSLVMAGVGMFCVGGFLLMIPTTLTDNARWLKPEAMTFVASLLGVSLNVGAFMMGPYIQIATSLGNDILAPLFFAIFGLAATIIVFFVVRLFQKEPDLKQESTT